MGDEKQQIGAVPTAPMRKSSSRPLRVDASSRWSASPAASIAAITGATLVSLSIVFLIYVERVTAQWGLTAVCGMWAPILLTVEQFATVAKAVLRRK